MLKSEACNFATSTAAFVLQPGVGRQDSNRGGWHGCSCCPVAVVERASSASRQPPPLALPPFLRRRLRAPRCNWSVPACSGMAQVVARRGSVWFSSAAHLAASCTPIHPTPHPTCAQSGGNNVPPENDPGVCGTTTVWWCGAEGMSDTGCQSLVASRWSASAVHIGSPCLTAAVSNKPALPFGRQSCFGTTAPATARSGCGGPRKQGHWSTRRGG